MEYVNSGPQIALHRNRYIWNLYFGVFAAILDELPRLHRSQNPETWQRYAKEIGIALINPAVGACYHLHSMQIEAALAGLGVALAPRLYIETELAEGRLVAP